MTVSQTWFTSAGRLRPVLLAAAALAGLLPAARCPAADAADRSAPLALFDLLNPPDLALPLAPVEHHRADPRAVVAGFVRHLQADRRLDPALRRQMIASLKSGDPADNPDLLTDALALRYPALARALEALALEQAEKAGPLLEQLAGTEDPYLVAEALFEQARLFIQQEDYESARPLLEQVLQDHLPHTLYGGQALFLLGVCQAGLLDRQRAAQTLQLFLEHYPDESERLRVGAQHLLDELQAIGTGTIIDVADRMDFSRRRLELVRPAGQTRRQQEKIIRLLDALIKQAENRENASGSGSGSGGGASPGPAQGNQSPNSPAQSSTAPVGQARIGSLHRVQRGSAAEVWGQARKKEIDKVISAPTSRIPPHYRELIEQYYRSMQQAGQDDQP